MTKRQYERWLLTTAAGQRQLLKLADQGRLPAAMLEKIKERRKERS